MGWPKKCSQHTLWHTTCAGASFFITCGPFYRRLVQLPAWMIVFVHPVCVVRVQNAWQLVSREAWRGFDMQHSFHSLKETFAHLFPRSHVFLTLFPPFCLCHVFSLFVVSKLRSVGSCRNITLKRTTSRSPLEVLTGGGGGQGRTNRVDKAVAIQSVAPCQTLRTFQMTLHLTTVVR